MLIPLYIYICIYIHIYVYIGTVYLYTVCMCIYTVYTVCTYITHFFSYFMNTLKRSLAVIHFGMCQMYPFCTAFGSYPVWIEVSYYDCIYDHISSFASVRADAPVATSVQNSCFSSCILYIVPSTALTSSIFVKPVTMYQSHWWLNS